MSGIAPSVRVVADRGARRRVAAVRETIHRVAGVARARVALSRFAARAALLACLAVSWPPAEAAAGVPAVYAPVVVEPTGTPARYEFDLTAALAQARRDGKRVYLYLGASDCPYCRRYEAFLAKNAAALAAPFAERYLVVDLRSALSATSGLLRFRVGERSWSYAEFNRSIGDERARMLVYPSVWLLDTDLRPLMQMPAGTGTFETVDEQLEILRLEQ